MINLIETERLILKPTNKDDAEFILELLNTPKWIKNIGDRNIRSLDDAKKYIAEKIQPQFARLGFGNFTVIRKFDGKKIGSCGLYDREGIQGVDIGFGFMSDYEKKGYAFESAIKLKQLAKDRFKLNQINAITSQHNLASQKLILKLGLTYSHLVTLTGSDEELMFFQVNL